MSRAKRDLEFSTLDLKQTAQIFSRHLMASVPCRNVLWITRETLDRLKVSGEKNWRWTIDAERGVSALKPTTLGHLFQYWKGTSKALALDELKLAQRIQVQGVTCIAAPVWGPQTKRDHWLLSF